MKRLFALLLAGAMMLSLASCGSKEEPADPSPDANPSAETSAAEPAAWKPSGSIDFVCPYSAGGGSDVCARTIASVMGNYTDANAVVQNLSGSGGLVGTSYVVGKAGDDMTLCTYSPGQIASSLVNNPDCGWDKLTQLCVLALEEHIGLLRAEIHPHSGASASRQNRSACDRDDSVGVERLIVGGVRRPD